jgi:hypothetical protein
MEEADVRATIVVGALTYGAAAGVVLQAIFGLCLAFTRTEIFWPC